jgi:hypothetical protein
MSYLRAMAKDVPPDVAARAVDAVVDVAITHATHLAERKPAA